MAKSLVSCFFDSQCRIFNSTTVQTIRLGSIGLQYVTNSAVFFHIFGAIGKKQKLVKCKSSKKLGITFWATL